MEQVADGVKSERLQRLQALLTKQWQAFNGSFAGRTLDVLLEKPGRIPGQLVGKSPYLHAVQVMAPASMIGEIVPVHITQIGTNTLFGDIVSARAPKLAEAGA
jgi:tRNA-2-methylthio-N6-dimethylallyladenosine synthase